MDIRENLPVHEHAQPSRHEPRHEPRLRIGGLVHQAMDVLVADLAVLPRIEHIEAFTCEEGWTVPAVRWRGMRLADVIALHAEVVAGLMRGHWR